MRKPCIQTHAPMHMHARTWLTMGTTGYFHRVNGPAIESSDGSKEWWINGRRISLELTFIAGHRRNSPDYRIITGEDA